MNRILLGIYIYFLWVKSIECEVKNGKKQGIAGVTTNGNQDDDTSLNENKLTEKTYWLRKYGNLDADLMNIQAIIVKDENAQENCQTGIKDTTHRYLMCSGSILSSNLILTSANCLKQAVEMRHNIQAPLAVVIAPFAHDHQLIKVHSYRIHPSYTKNLADKDHFKYNIAVLKLACRIFREYSHMVRMPKIPMTETCYSTSCKVAIYKQVGKTSLIVYEMSIENMDMNERRKKRSFTEYDEKATQWNSTGLNISISYVNQSSKKNSPIVLKDVVGSLEKSAHDKKREIPNHSQNSFHEKNTKPHNEGCPQTGAPVISQGIQTAIVAIPCDERQSSTPWKFTDVYDSVDWINGIRKNWDGCWKKDGSDCEESIHSSSGSFKEEGCNNCVYNFFIEHSCTDPNNCSLPSKTKTSRSASFDTCTDYKSCGVPSMRFSTWRKQAITAEEDCPPTVPNCTPRPITRKMWRQRNWPCVNNKHCRIPPPTTPPSPTWRKAVFKLPVCPPYGNCRRTSRSISPQKRIFDFQFCINSSFSFPWTNRRMCTGVFNAPSTGVSRDVQTHVGNLKIDTAKEVPTLGESTESVLLIL